MNVTIIESGKTYKIDLSKSQALEFIKINRLSKGFWAFIIDGIVMTGTADDVFQFAKEESNICGWYFKTHEEVQIKLGELLNK